MLAPPRARGQVLYDYHLAHGPDIRVAWCFRLEHLPPHVHMVTSSRADPLLPLARLRARGLNDVIGLDLTPDDIAHWRADRRLNRPRSSCAARYGTTSNAQVDAFGAAESSLSTR
jgi:LuxR family maltose regulon positive regulatory protein